MQLLEAERGVDQDALRSLYMKHGSADIEFLQQIVENQLVEKERACRLWGDMVGFAYVDPLASLVTREAVEQIPRTIARKGLAIPLYLINDVLTVAMADPGDEALVRRLENISLHGVSPVFAMPMEILDALEIHYANADEIAESIENFERTQSKLLENLASDDVESLGENAGVIEILNALMYYAIGERASDIHMEAMEDRARIRLRVDGNLREYFQVSHALSRALIARLKVLCKVNIAEKRFPQDGRFEIRLGVGKSEFRVSFLPTMYGQKVVIRILAGAGQKSLISLDRMMISGKILKPMRRLLESPNGIFFVTGPTGSGKTTTLYAAMQELNNPKVNISTIEDPIEITLPGLNQSQVNSHIDLSFALLLRALMRQDPDIILLGEIRDKETAKIATEAALTGHLVLSTLHTNTAPQAIIRLVEIGIEPYMVAPSILGVLAQRLAARICEKCKEAYFPSHSLLEKYFSDIPEDMEVPFYHGTGCVHCRNTGYSGRVAFHELVLVSNKMRSLIAQNAGQAELSAAAAELGYRPLRYDGLKKVLLGLTTPEEVDRHSVLEWSS